MHSRRCLIFCGHHSSLNKSHKNAHGSVFGKSKNKYYKGVSTDTAWVRNFWWQKLRSSTWITEVCQHTLTFIEPRYSLESAYKIREQSCRGAISRKCTELLPKRRSSLSIGSFGSHCKKGTHFNLVHTTGRDSLFHACLFIHCICSTWRLLIGKSSRDWTCFLRQKERKQINFSRN